MSRTPGRPEGRKRDVTTTAQRAPAGSSARICASDAALSRRTRTALSARRLRYSSARSRAEQIRQPAERGQYGDLKSGGAQLHDGQERNGDAGELGTQFSHRLTGPEQHEVPAAPQWDRTLTRAVQDGLGHGCALREIGGEKGGRHAEGVKRYASGTRMLINCCEQR